MSTQDTTAPKRRSAAANRRRRKRQGGVDESQVAGQQTPEQDEPEGERSGLSRAERKAAARGETVETGAAETPQEKHLRRQQERREAKSRQPEKKRGRFVNTDRFSGVQGFYFDTASEIKKVIWPDRDTTRNLTIVVMVLSVILGLMLGGIDYVLFQLFEAMA